MRSFLFVSNTLVTFFVKTLLSRNFCLKQNFRVNSRIFHAVSYGFYVSSINANYVHTLSIAYDVDVNR